MPVNTCVLEVDPRGPVFAHDDLHFVVPAVGARADLDAFDNFIGAAEHVCAEFGAGFGGGVVEAEDEEGGVDYIEAFGVVRVFVSGQDVSQAGPDLSILCTENAQGTSRRFLDGGLLRIVDDDLKIDGQILFCHDQVGVVVQDVEPIKLAFAEHDYVFRSAVLRNLASVLRWYSSGTEESRVLVHA